MQLLQRGQIFASKYRIDRLLARGGFGEVYLAEQTETELRVAVKVLRPHVLGSTDAVQMFKLEARIAGRVGSDHIVKVFDAGFDETTEIPYLVMELLSGEDLERVVQREGVLEPGRVITYLRQVASALDKAHGYIDKDGIPQPIVHRDLKPENLFLAARESGEPIVKVLDFGIAKVLSNSTKVTQEVKGTPLYMAYEQAAGTAITPQTDVWPLGLIAFHLLTGKSYWKAANAAGASLSTLFAEVLALPIDPPSVRLAAISSASTLPAEFDAWFARCVNRDPSARFATAGECVAVLSSVFGMSQIRASPGALLAESAGDLPHSATVAAVTEPRAADTSAPESTSMAALGGTKAPEVVPKRSLSRVALIAIGIVLALGVGGAVAVSRSATAPSEVTVGLGAAVDRAPERVTPSANPVVAPTVSPTVAPSSEPSVASSAAPSPAPSTPRTTAGARAKSAPAMSSQGVASPATKTNEYEER